MSKKEIKNSPVDDIYEQFKNKRNEKYDEEKHCKLLINVMLDPLKGTMNSYCVAATIHEKTFWTWLRKHELFRDIYYHTKNVAREIWEREGLRLRDLEFPLGTVNYAFEHWKLIGWSRFGVSRNPRLKLQINDTDTPKELYQNILRQARDGEFTASEFKQLMEAVNIGINVHKIDELQKEINELKSDLLLMKENRDVHNPFSDKGIAKSN